jgi:hypothetical protein
VRHQRTTSDCLRNAVAAGSSPRRAGRNVDTATHWPFTEMVVNSLTCFTSPDPSPIETRITMYHRAAATRQRSNASRWSASPRSRAYKDVEAALVLCRKGKHTDAYCSVNVQLQGLASMKALLIIVVAALASFFTVVAREEKYKAKNLIDVVVYRGSDPRCMVGFLTSCRWRGSSLAASRCVRYRWSPDGSCYRRRWDERRNAAPR